jgi:hypothetical protein
MAAHSSRVAALPRLDPRIEAIGGAASHHLITCRQQQ